MKRDVYNPSMPQRHRLHEIVDSFPGRRIMAYGDPVLDRFVLGQPKRISREAPVIILHLESQRDLPGGGANAMANIAALGAEVIPVGALGDDEPGQALRTALAQRGIAGKGLVTVPGLRTTTKVRILAGGPSSLRFQVARYDIEDSIPPSAPCQQELLLHLRELAAEADAVTVSDYGYGSVKHDFISVLREALPRTSPIVVDSRFALSRFRGVDGATPNLEELAARIGFPLLDDDSVASAAEQLRMELGARFVVATRGSQGMTLVEEGRKPKHVAVFGNDQVADVTGAGDTVLATLTTALAAGASCLEAVHLANLAGGIVVMKAGTATVGPAELHRAIELAEKLA